MTLEPSSWRASPVGPEASTRAPSLVRLPPLFFLSLAADFLEDAVVVAPSAAVGVAAPPTAPVTLTTGARCAFSALTISSSLGAWLRPASTPSAAASGINASASVPRLVARRGAAAVATGVPTRARRVASER